MSKRRITITRSGAVKLRGVETRWRYWIKGWNFVRSPSGEERRFNTDADARAYLDTLTDADLLG